MRKCQQKQIIELVNTLSEANVEIKRLYSQKKISLVTQLLADCQDCAIKIGNYIEHLEGEGTHTISLLEEYCQLLYQTSIEINGMNTDIKFVKRLQKQIIKIENSVKDELKPNKIEIVFLPYKASMWDSFESIWLAAKNDPQCDVYVVAIPYYDKISGSNAFGMMHYEGGQYPKYVPIVDWHTYDIEERHPDVIFTHNPYDEGNYVTSVHPDYYSKRLKSLADLLCYVPYYVVSDYLPEHFITCAGPIYADKVFVQSDKVRDTYVRVFKEFERANNCVGRFGKAVNKFISSGSPKFDKVINSKPGDYEIPKEWERLIKNPDGSLKKTILYNTSIGTLLSGDDKVLKKLRYVFGIFENRDDIILWWRPHPLNEATYESMRPHLAKEYKSIISEYRRKGFGIYDDTPDLHRAICLSSAYMGDWSSLVPLYQCAGKPVLIQDLESYFGVGNPLGLRFKGGDAEDTIWMFATAFNGLYKLNTHTLDIEFAGVFPDEIIDGSYLYSSAARIGSKVYFVPNSAKEMAILDVSDNTFYKIPLPSPLLGRDISYQSNFFSAVVFGKFIFLLPRCFPAIVRYDSESGVFEQYTDWLSSFDSFSNVENYPYPIYLCGVTVVGTEFFSVFRDRNSVIAFDMEKCVSTVYEVGNKGQNYSGICFDGEYFWLSPYVGSTVVRWNRQTGEWKEYPTSAGGGICSFINTIYAGGYIWMLPCTGKTALRIDPENEKFDVAEAFQAIHEESDSDYSEHKFGVFTESNGKLFAFSEKTQQIIKYDPITGEMERRSTIVEHIPCIDYTLHYKDLLIENDMYTIHNYVYYILSRNENDDIKLERAGIHRKAISNGDGKAGEEIYKMLKKELIK